MFASSSLRTLAAIIAGALLIPATIFAQTTGLSDDLIKKLQSDFDQNRKNPAIYNALSANDINALAVDRDKLVQHNAIFNKTIETGEMTNQEASGRCWMFAGSNLLRPQVMKKYKLGTFKLSTNYLFFWDKLEKSNTFLEMTIELAGRPIDDREVVMLFDDPCGDGGWWSYVVDLVSKYGVVPDQVMPETYATAHTGSLNAILNRKLRGDAMELREMHAAGKPSAELRTAKEAMLKEVYTILALNFGVPPQKFVWRYESKDSVQVPPKEYTPRSFYDEVIDTKLEDMVAIFDHPGVEYFEYYELGRSRSFADRTDLRFINLPIDSLKRYSLATLLGDQPVYFSCDIGQDNYGGKGVLAREIFDFKSLYGFDVRLSKRERVLTRDSYPNHSMVLTGVDTVNGVATKWKVENSWGDKPGDKGWWTMYDDWFDEFVYCVIVDKKLLTKEVAALLKTEPTQLPSWDPMWEAIRKMK